MAKVIMVQGTMSNAGKSLICAGLCRVFRQDGYRVAPFKSQNMALNSYITEDHLEMGRAQVMQAEAAGIRPDVCMNPILLKPVNDMGSQVIVNGKVMANMRAKDYFRYKKQLIPDILDAFRKLESMADIIVIEGAGSPAEINLKKDDIVNMGLAELVDAPVLLVGDIDRGGVFAQLLGTLMLLEENEKARVKGLIINKFRGDKTILDPGIVMLEERGNVPVVGLVPYVRLQLEDEDSLTERFEQKAAGRIRLAVVRTPRISNFTDFNVFEQFPDVSVNYVTRPSELEGADMIFLPGSKNTMGDLKWLRESGMEVALKKASGHTPVFGICGGYQMLGMDISDPDGVEEGGWIRGMELLPVSTTLQSGKVRTQCGGILENINGIFTGLSHKEYTGYEIHMGKTEAVQDKELKRNADVDDTLQNMLPDSENKTDRVAITASAQYPEQELPPVVSCGNIYGTYIHGIFDREEICSEMIRVLAEKKGIVLASHETMDYQAIKEREYDKLADTIRRSMDMKAIYAMLQESRYQGKEKNKELDREHG